MGPKSLIQQEIRQNKPFRSEHQEAFIALLRTADLMRRKVAAVVEPYGITPQQYNILRILRGAGEAGLATLAIGERLIEQTPGITRLLDRLDAKKLIRRRRCAEDRRQVLCSITVAGLDLLARLDDPVDRMDREALGMLSSREIRQLIELLDRIRHPGAEAQVLRSSNERRREKA